jgi:hypothetical protein
MSIRVLGHTACSAEVVYYRGPIRLTRQITSGSRWSDGRLLHSPRDHDYTWHRRARGDEYGYRHHIQERRCCAARRRSGGRAGRSRGSAEEHQSAPHRSTGESKGLLRRGAVSQSRDWLLRPNNRTFSGWSASSRDTDLPPMTSPETASLQ